MKMLSINIKNKGILKVKSEFMYPVLLHIYGPLNINTYGVAIALGVILFIHYAFKDPVRCQLMTDDQFLYSIQGSILVGIVSAKILDILAAPQNYQSFYDIIAFWQGGFSILGAVLGISVFLIFQLIKLNIPVLKFLDVCALYAPLLQAFGRIGCFFAGCCYGIPFAQESTSSMLCSAFHPTQLYSAGLLFLLFLVMQYSARYRGCLKPGILFGFYLLCISAERFIVDFWRADRRMITAALSFHQIIALVLMGIAALLMGWFLYSRSTSEEYNGRL